MYYYITHTGMFKDMPTAGQSTSTSDMDEAMSTLAKWARTMGEGETITFQCCPDE